MAPYSNVPESQWGDMESCVNQVMAQGRDKESAIAICHDSIVKGDDCPGCPKKRKAVHRARRAPHTTAAILKALAEDAEEEAALAGIEIPDTLPVDDEPAPAPAPSPAVKSVSTPAAVPLTIEAIQAQREAERQAQAKAQLVADYRAVLDSCNPDDEETPMHLEREANAFKRAWLAVTGAAKAIMEKVGARHSKSDMDMLQQMHDNAVALGAMCKAAAKSRSAFYVMKAADGSPVWVGVVSNNFKDRDGEIITEAAHQEFLSYLDANPDQAPTLRTWHVPGTDRKARADMWGYADGFLFMSGPLTPDEAARFAEGETLGMSHGFKAVKHGQEITQYRSFEVSELPLDAAANPWTEFAVTKEAPMFDNAEQRAHLVKRFGEEVVARLEESAAENSKALAEAGVEFKESTPAPAAPETPKPEAKAAQEVKAEAETPVADTKAIDELRAQLAQLQGTVQALTAANEAAAKAIAQQDEDMKALAQATFPRRMPFAQSVTQQAPAATDEHPAVKAAGENPHSWVRQIGPIVRPTA